MSSSLGQKLIERADAEYATAAIGLANPAPSQRVSVLALCLWLVDLSTTTSGTQLNATLDESRSKCCNRALGVGRNLRKRRPTIVSVYKRLHLRF
jgi:hypothetical protein